MVNYINSLKKARIKKKKIKGYTINYYPKQFSTKSKIDVICNIMGNVIKIAP